MSKPRGKVRIAVKYCGGCNPDFDRVEAVAAMLERLADVVEVVPLEGGSADLLAAVEGCPAACADLSAVKAARIVILASREAIERFVPELRSPGTSEHHFPEVLVGSKARTSEPQNPGATEGGYRIGFKGPGYQSHRCRRSEDSQ